MKLSERLEARGKGWRMKRDIATTINGRIPPSVQRFRVIEVTHTIGPHVLARVPFTDERALSQPAEGEDIMVNTPYDVFTLPLRPSGLDGNGPRFVVHVPAPEQQPAAVSDDDDAEPGEPCESGLPDCGPAVAWDCEGIGACERCARELGWIATPHREPTTPL